MDPFAKANQQKAADAAKKAREDEQKSYKAEAEARIKANKERAEEAAKPTKSYKPVFPV
jgi:hypothetical protein